MIDEGLISYSLCCAPVGKQACLYIYQVINYYSEIDWLLLIWVQYVNKMSITVAFCITSLQEIRGIADIMFPYKCIKGSIKAPELLPCVSLNAAILQRCFIFNCSALILCRYTNPICACVKHTIHESVNHALDISESSTETKKNDSCINRPIDHIWLHI